MYRYTTYISGKYSGFIRYLPLVAKSISAKGSMRRTSMLNCSRQQPLTSLTWFNFTKMINPQCIWWKRNPPISPQRHRSARNTYGPTWLLKIWVEFGAFSDPQAKTLLSKPRPMVKCLKGPKDIINTFKACCLWSSLTKLLALTWPWD